MVVHMYIYTKKLLHFSLLYHILCLKLKWFKGKLAPNLGLQAWYYGRFRTLLVKQKQKLLTWILAHSYCYIHFLHVYTLKTDF